MSKLKLMPDDSLFGVLFIFESLHAGKAI